MVLRSELDTLKSLTGKLTARAHAGSSVTLSEHHQIILVLHQESDRLHNQWLRQLFSNTGDKALSRYVRFHQQGLTALSDQVIPETTKISDVPERQPLVTEVLVLVEELIRYLEITFQDYFDRSAPESRYRRLLDQRAFEAQLGQLREALDARLPGSEMAGLILQSLHERTSDLASAPLTYAQQAGIAGFIESFAWFAASDKAISEKELFLLACRLDFNARRLCAWFKHSFSATPLFTEEEAYIALLELRPPGSAAFEPADRSLRETLLAWLSRRKAKAANPANGLPSSPMPLTLSVVQFSMFIRICYRSGCFSLDNAAQIVRFFATRFTTKRQTKISLKSFTKGFYSTDQTATAVLRDLLQRMIVMIDQTYFP
jgi:hypothetical protein